MTSPDVLYDLERITRSLLEISALGQEAQHKAADKYEFSNELERQDHIRGALDQIKVHAYRLAPLCQQTHEQLKKSVGPVDLTMFALAEQIPVLARIDSTLNEDLQRTRENTSWILRTVCPLTYERKRSDVILSTLGMANDIASTLYILSGLLLMHIGKTRLQANARADEALFSRLVMGTLQPIPKKEWGLAYQISAYWNLRRLFQMLNDHAKPENG